MTAHAILLVLHPAAGTTFATWSPTLHNAHIVVSNANLTVKDDGISSNTYYSGLASKGSTTGQKSYYEINVDTIPTGQIGALGVALSTLSLADGTWLGDGGPSVGVWNDGTVFGSTGGGTLYATGDKVCFAVDLSAGFFWARTNGGLWNNSGTANPATNTGGIGASGGDLYPAYTCEFRSGGSVGFTCNFGSSAYSFTPPSGFGNL
jgi:hypothetical protein